MTTAHGNSVSERYVVCPLCEASCGLKIEVSDKKILSIRGNGDDVFSRGHVCPKGVALQDLHEDPDRVRRPMLRRGDAWEPVTWQAAFECVAERMHDIQSRYGKDSVAIYGGNPTAHNLGIHTHYGAFLAQVQTRNIYSAASLDILPVQLVALLLYGHQFLLPVADIDRTQHLLVIGANPMVSNGSMMTVPDFPGRLKGLKSRGGRMIVVDPRRTETARTADAHHFIRPGSDAYLLLAMLDTLFREDRVDLGKMADHVEGLEKVRQICARVPAELAAKHTGIAKDVIRTLALEFSDADSAACYGRIGVSVQRYSSICQWAIQLLNLLTGNFDRPGGVLFCEHAAPDAPSPADAGSIGRWHSRVSGYPEFGGLMPVAALAEEVLTPGEGRVRALISLAGNPLRSAPNSGQMREALASLDLLVSIDPYRNETAQYAHVLLPPVSPLQRGHYPIFTARFGVRNSARYSPPLFQPGSDELQDWQILQELMQRTAKLNGVRAPSLPTPEEALDTMFSRSIYPGLSVEKLIARPEGIDFGPLKPMMPERLLTPGKRINLASEIIFTDIEELLANASAESGAMLLIGRRNARSNNSWMHNLPRLMARRPDHHLLIHPDDADTYGVTEGLHVELKTAVGTIEVEARVSDEVMPGCICLPHGWDHKEAGKHLSVASLLPGANFNLLVDDALIDKPSAGSVLQGVPCTLRPLTSAG